MKRRLLQETINLTFDVIQYYTIRKSVLYCAFCFVFYAKDLAFQCYASILSLKQVYSQEDSNDYLRIQHFLRLWVVSIYSAMYEIFSSRKFSSTLWIMWYGSRTVPHHLQCTAEDLRGGELLHGSPPLFGQYTTVRGVKRYKKWFMF